ncbi:hypothetical protein PACILC2_18200 [Paenibacillus cisolokensis]|uniref:Copper amine oxidase-like N-terminal domain-containing protein n=2 Tax=Paenibacillus cisolokensis TaxID=1658519 RepID=A0ABQ4N4Z5_9BACL|nr:hypothetical protein PACILC2_18200 [Paenibacillus cisolokensis]
MNASTLERLEYNRIRAMLADYTVSPEGRQLAERHEPETNPKRVRAWLNETSEAAALLATGASVPLSAMEGVGPLLSLLGKSKIYNEQELGYLSAWLQAIAQMKRYMNGKRIKQGLLSREIMSQWMFPVIYSSLYNRLNLEKCEGGDLKLKKNNLWLSSLALIICLSFSSFSSVHAEAKSTVKIRYESRFVSEFPEITQEMAIEKGRIFLPLRDLASILQLMVQWNQKQKTATFIQPGKELVLSTQTNKIMSNGQTYLLDVPLKIYKQRIYVPVRFVAEWFDGEAKWDAQTRTVLIKDNSPFISTSLDHEMYWFDHLKGTLYRSTGGQSSIKLGSYKLPAGSGSGPTFSSIKAEKLSASNRWLSMNLAVHGIGVNYVRHGLFLKDGQVLNHSELEYSGEYPLKHMDRYDEKAVLSDGIQVQIMNAEGEIIKIYDLQALTGIEDRMMIEKVTDKYMLVRPFNTPYLVLIDLVKKESVKLYQRFYSEEDQAASENVGYNSTEFHQFFDLKLVKEVGDTLYFTRTSIESGETLTYTYTIGK